ncbi:hypothetical protein [Enterococcus faecium]|uniref:hypothetical protein n=1 Tax=Enterococcus faecium TaxID=1352 RepID=UPI000A33103D|nr:hypothetical protein [Enterococcus faecium]OTN91127.1 hypothetical protein A5809_000491 [Enterococcus faecium]
MKKTIKTEEAYIEVFDTLACNMGVHIYSNIDPDMFVEIYLSQREYKALYKILGEFAKEEDE